jgi:hypothetical protein
MIQGTACDFGAKRILQDVAAVYDRRILAGVAGPRAPREILSVFPKRAPRGREALRARNATVIDRRYIL